MKHGEACIEPQLIVKSSKILTKYRDGNIVPIKKKKKKKNATHFQFPAIIYSTTCFENILELYLSIYWKKYIYDLYIYYLKVENYS